MHTRKSTVTESDAKGPALRFDRAEAGGALGDLGTFIPLLVAMVNRPVLFCAGLMSLTTGLVFRIPMPVQPMKAIAAVAIDEGLNESQIISAGVATGHRVASAEPVQLGSLVHRHHARRRSTDSTDRVELRDCPVCPVARPVSEAPSVSEKGSHFGRADEDDTKGQDAPRGRA